MYFLENKLVILFMFFFQSSTEIQTNLMSTTSWWSVSCNLLKMYHFHRVKVAMVNFTVYIISLMFR